MLLFFIPLFLLILSMFLALVQIGVQFIRDDGWYLVGIIFILFGITMLSFGAYLVLRLFFI